MEQKVPDETDDNQILMAIYVQLSRILDALYIIAGPEQAKKLDELHSRGGLLSSEPLLIASEDEETD